MNKCISSSRPGTGGSCVINLKYNNNHKIFAFCSPCPRHSATAAIWGRNCQEQNRVHLRWAGCQPGVQCPLQGDIWAISTFDYVDIYRDRYLLYKDNVLLLVDTHCWLQDDYLPRGETMSVEVFVFKQGTRVTCHVCWIKQWSCTATHIIVRAQPRVIRWYEHLFNWEIPGCRVIDCWAPPLPVCAGWSHEGRPVDHCNYLSVWRLRVVTDTPVCVQ